MADELYGLTDEQIKRLAKALHAYESGVKPNPQPILHRQPADNSVRPGKADEAIPSEDHGTVSIWTWNKDTDAFEDTTKNVEVYNFGDVEIASGAKLLICPGAGGIYYALTEFCTA